MTVRAATKKPPEDIVEEFDVEQRGEDWYSLRLGLPTASNFAAIMAQSDARAGRAKLLNRLAAEIIFKRPMETFSNAAMERGLDMEPAALDHYAFTRDVEVRRVGFVRRTIRDPILGDLVVGCSPDGLVGDDGVVQVKTMQPDLIVALVDSGRFPSEHRWQCQGELWVTGRRWADLKIYYDEFPLSPSFRIERDDVAIAELRKGVEVFAYDLKKLVADVRKKGGVR
jgi:hypothetical protein